VSRFNSTFNVVLTLRWHLTTSLRSVCSCQLGSFTLDALPSLTFPPDGGSHDIESFTLNTLRWYLSETTTTMATFDLPFQRRKVTTYGKVARKPSNNLGDLDASPEKPALSVRPQPDIRSGLPRFPENQRTGAGKLTRPSLQKAQTELFDVPPSDEESPQPAPNKPSVNQVLASKSASSTNEKGHVSRSDVENRKKRKRNTGAQHTVGIGGYDLMERIQAELRATEADGPSKTEEYRPQEPKQRPAEAKNQFDARIMKRRQKKPFATTSAARSGLRIGKSAPAALQSMLSESESNRTRSPAMAAATPEPPSASAMDVDFLPSTPPMRALDSPTPGLPSGAVTPRQKDLWNKLIPTSDATESPSELPISKLDLSRDSDRKIRKKNHSNSEKASFGRARRGRLVDMLKDAAPQDANEEEAEDSEDTTDDNMEMFSGTDLGRRSAQDDKPECSSQQSETYVKTATKVTYAQQRSYLEERTEEDALDMLAEELGHPSGFLATQIQPPMDEELDEEDDSQRAQPRSVHDLRAAGTKRRLLHELEALVNEVEGQGFNSLSSKRSALVELSIKLFNKDAVACCLDHGLDSEIVKNCSKTTDTVFNFSAAVTVASLIAGGATLRFLTNLHGSECFRNIIQLLDSKQDISKIVKDRKANMSKIAQISILDFKTEVLNSDLWTTAKLTTLSPRLTSLKALELFVRRLRELGSHENVLDEVTLGTLLSIAESTVSLHTKEQALDIITLESVLSTLESSTLIPSSLFKRSGWSIKLLKKFANIIPHLLSAGDTTTTHAIETLALRLMLNLTNNNARACDVFASPVTVQPVLRSIINRFDVLLSNAAEETRIPNLDKLILSLGALINLTEWSNEARLSTVDGSDKLLDQVVRLFAAGRERAAQAESIQASQTNVAYGYLAVLLGNICQNDKIRKLVEDKLPSGRLDPLIEAVEEFIRFNQKVDKEVFEGDEGNEVFVQFTDRLKAVVERLRRNN